MPPGHQSGYYAPMPPPPPRRSSATVWVTAGVSAFTAAVALVVCVALVVNSPAATDPASGGAANRDPSQYYSKEMDARPSAVELDITAHPAYDLAMPEEVGCDLPDLQPQSDQSWKKFSGEIGDCLSDLWQPRLEELGLRTEPPTFHVTEDNPDAGSAQEGMTLAYYEHDKLSITVVLPNVTELAREVPDEHQEGVWSALLGHEYGHHVQQSTGILDASYEMSGQASTESEELEVLRRTELQAECMGGVAMRGLGTFDDAEIDKVNEFLNGGSDLPTHGTSQNRQHWFDRGVALDTVDACNTFDAPAVQVR